MFAMRELTPGTARGRPAGCRTLRLLAQPSGPADAAPGRPRSPGGWPELLVAATGAALLTGCVATPVPPQKSISGTARSVRGHLVDVMLGLDVIDAAGHTTGMGAKVVGYSVI